MFVYQERGGDRHATSSVALKENVRDASMSMLLGALKNSSDLGRAQSALSELNRRFSEDKEVVFAELRQVSKGSVKRFSSVYYPLVSQLAESTSDTTQLGIDSRKVKAYFEEAIEWMRKKSLSSAVFNAIFRVSRKEGHVCNEELIRERIDDSVERHAPLEVVALWHLKMATGEDAITAKDSLIWLLKALEDSNVRFSLKLIIQDIVIPEKLRSSELFTRAVADLQLLLVQHADPRVHLDLASNIAQRNVLSIQWPQPQGQFLVEVAHENPNAVYVTNALREYIDEYSGLPISFIRERKPITAQEMQCNLWRIFSTIRDSPLERVSAAKEVLALSSMYPEKFANALMHFPPPSYSEIASSFSEFAINKLGRNHFKHLMEKQECPDRGTSTAATLPTSAEFNQMKRGFADFLEAWLKSGAPNPVNFSEVSSCLSSSLEKFGVGDAAQLANSFAGDPVFRSSQEMRTKQCCLLIEILKGTALAVNKPRVTQELSLAFKNAENRIASIIASEAVQVFLQPRYRKAQPLEAERLQKLLAKKIMRGEPLEFVFLWGAFKESASGCADSFDAEALIELKKLHAAVSKVYTPTPGEDGKPRRNSIRIIFTDVFAERVNGRDVPAVERYYASLADTVAGLDFLCDVFVLERLSEHYLKWARNERFNGFNQFIACSLCAAAKIDKHPELFSRFTSMAEKHSTLVHSGKMSMEESASIYLSFRAWESANLLADRYPIFISAGEPETEKMFSSAPTFFVTLDKRTIQVPWFVDQMHPPSRGGSQDEQARPPSAFRTNLFSAAQLVEKFASEGIGEMGSTPSNQQLGALSKIIRDQLRAELAKAAFVLGEKRAVGESKIYALANSAAFLALYGDVAYATICRELAAQLRASGKREFAKPEALDLIIKIVNQHANALEEPRNIGVALKLKAVAGAGVQDAPSRVARNLLRAVARELKQRILSEFIGTAVTLSSDVLIASFDSAAEEALKRKPVAVAVVAALDRKIFAELLLVQGIVPQPY